jgi:hypothetical protein
MTTLTFVLPPGAELDPDQRDALARLDDDLAAITRAATLAVAVTAEVLEHLHLLRRRALAAYRDALARAAGRPNDPSWNVLALTVAAFVARAPEAQPGFAAGAAARLRALVEENGAPV